MEKRTALALSGTAHAGVIVWALLAGFFNPVEDEESLQIASVGIVSTAEFDALVSRTPGPGTPSPDAPTAPEAPTTPDAPVAETPPPQPPQRPETPAPTPPDTTPDVAQLVTPPTTEAVTETPDAPPPPAAEDAPVSTRPTPRQADIVTQRPTPAPPPLVEIAPTVEASSEPSELPEPEAPVEPEEQAAPEETTTAVVTEADEPAAAEITSLAPEDSPRPGRRPARPEPTQTAAAATETPAPAQTTEPSSTAPASEPRQVDTSDALREALSGGGSAAQEGPQLTDGQKEGFRLAVQACWDLGAVSTDVTNTIVEVRFQMREDGFPVSSSIRLEGTRGGTDASAQIALERARQAIIGCSRQNGGYDLPAESYDDWKDIIITFDPTRR
ncbi:Cell division and transport-associated protein TolA [Jannaschia faecimaris]|uniref:Cell division and transport-associated protein TolA n=1 Tax=Jannaschia faecimaris TaxID=1244108 RepID=A0A1H3L7W8_9RHOB|nr:hypothetical protein [Jannaschia faecimaris]SDY60289.1 Cell division and transport-associated protein TolA [Jannaschia faecimaris]